MPHNRELEHDGNDFFEFNQGFPKRKDVKIVETKKKKIIEDNVEKELENAQKEWMNPENPALWDGEF